MESTTTLRENHTLKKKNKENVQPAQQVKSFIKQHVSKVAAPPLQTNGNKKEILAKTGKVATVKQVVRRQNIAEQSSGKTTTTLKTAKKQSHSQDSGAHSQKTEQAAKLKKPVGETPKPAPALQPPRPAPGMYKGRVVESKIGSIWKSSASARNEDQKSTAQNATNQKAGSRTTSAAGRGTSASASTRSVKPSVNAFSSARPPVRSVPTTVRPRNATVAQSRRCGTMIAKPKVPVTDTKASKPPVTSTVRQYRANSETAEEKRAKLAEWLASKGKTLKRPAMVPPATSTKVKLSNKPAAPEPQTKAQLTTKSNSKPEAKEPKPVPPALTTDNQEVVQVDERRTSLLMNTTLDLLENSDVDLPVDSQDGGRVDDIVMNLCDALEALETPSQCDNDLPQLKDECGDETEGECKPDVKSETPDNGIVKSEGDDQEVQDESEESDDDCYVDENAPPTEGASVVKYSVKTTPFLQSVKKTIVDEVSSSTSKRKSNIKDIKFLTPVRRSSRINRQSSRLPMMLVDHDPCVSSLAELVQLDDDANAYIYRKNPALLEDLPDQPRL